MRDSWKDLHRQQAEAEQARSQYAEKQERDITRVAEALSLIHI